MGKPINSTLKGKAPAFVFSEKIWAATKENYLVFVTDPFFTLFSARGDSGNCHGQSAGQHVIEPPEELRRSLAKALDFPGQRRVCGDRHLCPAGVVRMVRIDSATE